MRRNLLLLLFALFILPVISQADEKPYIEVTGSAEMEIAPDEIILQVGFSEYFEEEYEEGKEWKDYQTKVTMDEIEPLVLAQLKELGINNNQITWNDGGNQWQQRGKRFLKRKEIHISITDFKQVDVLMTNLSVRGLDQVSIFDLKHKNMLNYRKQVKIDALKAAKAKAAYLVESVGQKIGAVLVIQEVENYYSNYNQPFRVQSNTVRTATPMESNFENFKKITIRYQVKARFEIL